MHMVEVFSKVIQLFSGKARNSAKQVLTPSSPLGITHFSVRVYISIRIGHRQQENIHFLQDGGDGWILPVIRDNLSRDNKCVSEALEGWIVRSEPVYLPQMPIHPPQPPCHHRRHEDTALRALESLREPGCMMPSPAGSWAAWFILSFQGVGQGSREPHINSY